MTAEYTYRTYGSGRVWDAELGAWREPMTEVELQLAKQYGELLKKSFAEVGTCHTETKSE